MRVASGEWRRIRTATVFSESRTMSLKSHRDLKVWQMAMELAKNCYRATNAFPREELFGLTSQIRRASASVPANIAEGQGRNQTKEILNHLSIARGSLMELDTHLELSQRIGFLSQQELEKLFALSDQISRMLSGLRRALRRRLKH